MFEAYFKQGMAQSEIMEMHSAEMSVQNYLSQGDPGQSRKKKSIRERYKHFVFSMLISFCTFFPDPRIFAHVVKTFIIGLGNCESSTCFI